MAAYFRKAGSWSKYLQNQAYVDDINSEISRSTREQVASIEALSRDNIRVNKSVEAAVRQVEVAVWSVDQSIQRLDSTFKWGFSTLIALVGSLGESVEELIRIAKIPNRIRAYEYYIDSRDAYGRNIFPEAGAAIEKALSGDVQSTTGYRLDWRFFHQKALVNLGGKGELHRFVNLDVAGDCAAIAVGLAVSAGDLPGASVASFTASFADYCRQRHDSALEWAIKSINFDPEHSAAVFQCSKVLMALGKPRDALQYLLAAVVLDRRFVLKALDESDGDFAPHRSIVTEAFEGLRRRVIAELTADLRILLADPAVWTSLLSTEEESKKWLTIAESLLVTELSAMPLFDVLQLREWHQTRLSDVKPLPDGWTIDLMSRALTSVDGLPSVLKVLEQRDDFRMRIIGELTARITVTLTNPAFWTVAVTTEGPQKRATAIEALLGTPDKVRLADVVRMAEWQREWTARAAPQHAKWTVSQLSQAVDLSRGLTSVRHVLEQLVRHLAESEEAAISEAWKEVGCIAAGVAGSVLGIAVFSYMADHVSGIFALGALLFALPYFVSVFALFVWVIRAISVTIARRSAASQWRSALC